MSALYTGHDLPSCPVCGSRACLEQAPGLLCRHTRRPRAAASNTPAPVGKTASNPAQQPRRKSR